MRLPNTDIETASVPSEIFEHFEGERMYELTNHLGNFESPYHLRQRMIRDFNPERNDSGVLSTVFDSRVITQSSGTITSIEAVLVSYADYYPFGSPMHGRQGQGASAYRYGFNGKEKDTEGMGGGQSTYDYGFRIYNPAIGRFLSVDPLTKGYPWYTPYQFAGNKPIWAVDLDGLEELIIDQSAVDCGIEIVLEAVSDNDVLSKFQSELTDLNMSNVLVIITAQFLGTGRHGTTVEVVSTLGKIGLYKSKIDLFEKNINVYNALIRNGNTDDDWGAKIIEAEIRISVLQMDIEKSEALLLDVGLTIEQAQELREANSNSSAIFIVGLNSDELEAANKPGDSQLQALENQIESYVHEPRFHIYYRIKNGIPEYNDKKPNELFHLLQGDPYEEHTFSRGYENENELIRECGKADADQIKMGSSRPDCARQGSDHQLIRSNSKTAAQKTIKNQ